MNQNIRIAQIIIIFYIFILIPSSLFCIDIFGKELEWNPGILGGIPTIPAVVNVMDFGATGDGVTDDSAAFQTAINTVAGQGAVEIPSGTYLIMAKLSLPDGVVLRGAGTDNTHLNINHSNHTFEMLTYEIGQWINITSSVSAGETIIPVADTSPFEVGLYVEIQKDNDPAIMYTIPDWDQSWADGAMGQITQVTAVGTDSITTDKPLRLDYPSSLNPVIRTNGFIEWVGFEDFHVKRIDNSDTSIFFFKNVANCWIKNIKSEYCSKMHVTTNTGYRIEVRDSFFNESTNWGGGGHGYGVELGFHSTDCLIVNNVFKHLRHSMMVHVGANGNFFGYNYSIEPQSEADWIPGDISLHGHYPYYNLFEGNIVNRIGIGDYWGPAGPNNTIFRNSVLLKDIYAEDSSQHQNIIGNFIEPGTFYYDQDDRWPHNIDLSTYIMHGNWYDGLMHWDPAISDHTIPDSYYYTSKPSFYGKMGWPSVGADFPGGGTNPARERWLAENPTPSPISTPDPSLVGDANGDGSVNIVDALLVAQYYVGLDPVVFKAANADTNCDGSVNIIDALLIAQFYVGLINSFC